MWCIGIGVKIAALVSSSCMVFDTEQPKISATTFMVVPPVEEAGLITLATNQKQSLETSHVDQFWAALIIPSLHLHTCTERMLITS